MTDRQVLLFGSFTEDEIRLMQCQLQQNDVGIKFGSIDSEDLRSAGFFHTRAADLCSCKGSQLPEPADAQNHVRLKRVDDTASDSRVNLSEENGFIGSDMLPKNNGVGFFEDYGLSKNSTFEQPGIPSLHELSSSVEDVVLDDSSNGVHIMDSSQHVFKESNSKNVTHRNFLPCGLVNMGNLCFLNATLQALLSCSPFFDLLFELKNRDIPKNGFPTLCAFVDFISDFDMLPDSICKLDGKNVLGTGKSFRPIMFDSILKSFTPDIPDNLSGRPRQEDAQEFLSFVMHQMHDELLKLDCKVSNQNGKTASLVSSTDDESDDDNWETVGPKNKSAITRTQSFTPSMLSAIFGGQLRSVVKARGNKASATIQPFLLLHLNICPEPVYTIEDALRLFSAPETLEGYRTSAAGKAEVVTASKSIKILELSEILVLHLMRFSYESRGSTKLHKSVHFPLELVVGRDLLASPSSEGRRYVLVATITHHGRDPSKGHYTADARHPSGEWLRYDDASVTPIPESEVLHDQA
ncbi:ubiquitin carboxyl-terminal hydrolase 24-like isoform X2 [Andrographis paniculata]|nr:ubiquitin carboxyl-terminal hydrolase 24-like isoform X2 [Andrographis paniculata]